MQLDHSKTTFSVIILLSMGLLLSNCGGPVSMVSYAVATGLSVHSHKKQEAYLLAEKYTNRCLPIDDKTDPMLFATMEEYKVSPDYVAAHVHYQIAEKIGDIRAPRRLEILAKKMTMEEKQQATAELAKYSDVNINSCFFLGPRH